MYGMLDYSQIKFTYRLHWKYLFGNHCEYLLFCFLYFIILIGSLKQQGKYRAYGWAKSHMH